METAKGSFSLEVMDPDNISGWRDEDPYFGSEKRGKNIILYDWFAMTSKVDSVESLLNQLGLKTSLPFKETKGFYGYRSRLKFDGISIYYDYCYKDTDYPLLELTGQGCRDYETYTDGNWGRLFQLALDTDNYHVTRLDVAYDDHEGILDINKIVRKTEKRHFVSRSQVGTITNSFDRDKDAYSVCKLIISPRRNPESHISITQHLLRSSSAESPNALTNVCISSSSSGSFSVFLILVAFNFLLKSGSRSSSIQ